MFPLPIKEAQNKMKQSLLVPEEKEDSSWKEQAVTFPASPAWTLLTAEQNAAG